MNTLFRNLLFMTVLLCSGSIAHAQLPNEKFGKPSAMEWQYNGWGTATNADAIILCKTMKVSYELTDQLTGGDQTYTDFNLDNLGDFGKNNIDDSKILVKYECRQRTKILKSEGAHHANIDITYFNADNDKAFNHDEVTDLKITVFEKNAKGKVAKRNVVTTDFRKERIDANYVVIHVVVPDVQAGSIVEYQYNITSARPAFLYDWTFQETIPTVRSKCDIEIPAFLKFNMNVPVNKLVKSTVKAGRLVYDANRADLKRAKSCVTNHYVIVGDYILPEGEQIAPLNCQIDMPHVTIPDEMPTGHTHLCIR